MSAVATPNKAQMRVLKAVAKGPKQTSTVTKGSTVSGVAAKALARQGLVKVVAKKGVPTHEVTITAAGRKLVAA